jgi:hypothetical protein
MTCLIILHPSITLRFYTVVCVAAFFLFTHGALQAQNASIIDNSNGLKSEKNVGIGVNALLSLAAPQNNHNTAIGSNTATLLQTGNSNTAAGTFGLYTLSSGDYNSAMGYGAMYLHLGNGNANTVFGYLGLRNSSRGSRYTAFGAYSLFNHNISNQQDTTTNIGLGAYSLYTNTTGANNVAIGTNALYFNTVGSINLAAGAKALNKNTTGSHNVAVGYEAMWNNQTGNNNVAMGATALGSLVSGNNNVAFGVNAGYLCPGSGNVFYGYEAGYSETGSNKLYMGNLRNQTLIYGDFVTRQVLLGVKNPFGYQFKGNRTLNVVGGIMADSIRVAPMNQWPDYVFEEDYPLMPLDALQSFVRRHKHLPGIPTAAEVAAEGIEAGTLTASLLEKIEELTLYIIAQDKARKQKKEMLRQSEEWLKEKIQMASLLEANSKRLSGEPNLLKEN